MNNMYFSAECSRIESLIKEYLPKCKELFENFSTQVVTKQYCYAGDIHRGYYNPSLIEDIIVGNTKRGRLTKKINPHCTQGYVYGFNKQSELITITKF